MHTNHPADDCLHWLIACALAGVGLAAALQSPRAYAGSAERGTTYRQPCRHKQSVRDVPAVTSNGGAGVDHGVACALTLSLLASLRAIQQVPSRGEPPFGWRKPAATWAVSSSCRPS